MTNEELFQRLNAGDTSAREQIILNNQPLITIVMRRYPRNNDPVYGFDDIFSACNIALIKAVDTFDPTKGVAFSTYAVRCITNAVLMVFRAAQRSVSAFSLNDTIADDTRTTYADMIIDPGKSFEKSVEERDMIACAVKAIDTLKPKPRRIMELVVQHEGEIFQGEIAKDVGISQPQCSRLMRKAQSQLRTVCNY